MDSMQTRKLERIGLSEDSVVGEVRKVDLSGSLGEGVVAREIETTRLSTSSSNSSLLDLSLVEQGERL